ncbi:MAG: hypothetical protein Q9182_004741 [Xanthomendoza sp. 2 TL-2023]
MVGCMRSENFRPVPTIEPPDGFRLRIERTGEGKALNSRDLYSATLYALLHFALQSYRAPAELYNTQGPEPTGAIVVSAVPFASLHGYIPQNCHLVWGLYRSVIAFNVPNNVRESAANVFLDGLRIAKIEWLQVSQARVHARDGSSNDTTSPSPVSEMQMMRLADHGELTPLTLKWRMSPTGHSIRRETAYDTVAFAILYTANFQENTRVQGYRTVSFPGGRLFVAFDSNPIGRWPAITWGQAARVVTLLPTFLEGQERFQDALVQLYTPDDRLIGMVGIFNKRNDDEAASIDPPHPGQLQTA